MVVYLAYTLDSSCLLPPPHKSDKLGNTWAAVVVVSRGLLFVYRELTARRAGVLNTGSKKEMAAEKSNDGRSAEGQQGREGTGTGTTAAEKEKEIREDNVREEESKQEQEQKEEEDEQLVIEQPLLTIKEVFVYQVPPLRASSGHRAEEWGLANPVFTGEW